MPIHIGYERLCLLMERQGKYASAIALANKVKCEKWQGTWEQKIKRCRVKISNQLYQIFKKKEKCGNFNVAIRIANVALNRELPGAWSGRVKRCQNKLKIQNRKTGKI